MSGFTAGERTSRQCSGSGLPPEQFDAAYRTASEVNRICKGAKVTLLPRHLDACASIEFLDGGTFTASQLMRYFEMLIHAAGSFRTALRKPAPTMN